MSRSSKFFLLSAFLLASVTLRPFLTYAGVPSCTLCDVDNDGTIEPADGQDDFILFVNILLGILSPNSQQFCAADVNQDGAVNGLDIQTWINICTVSNECNDNTDCDDSIACTDDVCSSGSCMYTPNNGLCDDGISCTDDVCNTDTGCANTAIQCGANPICIQCGPNQICNPSGSCVPTGICGNGIVDPGEECETDGDCKGGNVCAGCECVTSNFCGDGQVTGDEVCDVNGDIGCASSEGYICQQTCLPDCSACDPEGQPSCCGDNVIDDGEECDNGSFCEDGTECLYQSECAGIGDGVCQYRSEFSEDCSQTCELSDDLTLADFNQLAHARVLSAHQNQFYSVKAEGQCSYSYSRGDALNGPKGSSLKIDYNIESKQKPACKITVAINPKLFEAAGVNPEIFKTLKFYLKGSSQPFPKELKVEWRGAQFVASRIMAKSVASKWQLYEVPTVSDASNRSPEFSLTLERDIVPKSGTLYLDQISLSRSMSSIWPSCAGESCSRLEAEIKNSASNLRP